MSKHNKQNKQTATDSNADSGSNTALATMQAPPAVEVKVDSIEPPIASIRAKFEFSGDSLKLREGIACPSSEEFALFIEDNMNSAATAVSHSAYALYEAQKGGTVCYNQTVTRLALDGMSESALNNLKHVATSVIPFKLANKYQAPLSLLKDAIAKVRDNKGKTLTTPLSVALQKAFTTGVNPDGLKVQNSKGIYVDAGGKPITTVSIRAIIAGYDKDGAEKKPEVPASPTPAQTTEVRSGTASNATGEPEKPDSRAVVNETGGVKPELQSLVGEKPHSAGSSPATVGKPGPTSGTMTEGELIVAAGEALVNRMTAYSANHAFKVDERAALLVIAGKVAKAFGAEVVGV